jgi:hypothetical protein
MDLKTFASSVTTRVTRCVCENIAQNVAQSIKFTVGKSGPIIYTTSAIFTQPPKVNSHQTGENSNDLVTLVTTVMAALLL